MASSKSLIKFKKLCADAKNPTHAYAGDAGWDFYALEKVSIFPHSVKNVSTGIAIELPPPANGILFEAQIRPRSGHRMRGILVTFGTVDSGYRGEIGAIVANLTDEKIFIKEGEKICQIVVVALPSVDYVECSELTPSERGERGFGSSGD